jgi:hypothetical protein
MNILDAVHDKEIFAKHFQGDSWSAWLAFLAALFALPMTLDQLATYRKATGRSLPPTAPHNEAWLICGRRAGKSYVLATVAVYLACFIDWRPLLGPGEVGTIMVIADDRKQSRVIMRFIRGLMRSSPMLKRVITGETQESFTLRNHIVIEEHSSAFRSTRGYTTIAALLDEIAVWPTDEASATPDVEVINSIRPGMATIPNAMLLVASSPHAMRGALFDAYKNFYGRDGDPVLVWKATTREINQTVPQSFIDAQLRNDPARAAADYLAEFRSDVTGLLAREAVEACIAYGIRERPPDPHIRYTAFILLSHISLTNCY